MSSPLPAQPKPRPARKRLFHFLLFFPVVVLAAPFAIGRFLPEDYHGSAIAVFDAPPDAVWAALADHRTTPISGTAWKGTQEQPPEDGLPVWIEDVGESKVTVRTVESVPGERLVRELRDSVVPMTARREYRLEPAGDSGERTRVVATADIRVSDGTWHVAPFRCLLALMDGASGSVSQYLATVGGALGTEPQLE